MTCLLLLLVVLVVAKEVQQQDCAALGYSEATVCSTCAEMSTFVHDEAVTSECFQCCTEDRDGDDAQIAHSAVLVIDAERLNAWPNVDDFVKKSASKFADRLKVASRNWWRPVLELHDANEIVFETLDVANWERHQLEQFLQERVQASSK